MVPIFDAACAAAAG